MKKLLFILFVTICTSNNILAIDNLKIISSAEVESDYMYEGVKGINITYRYNFLQLEELNHNDTILKDASFGISTVLYENGIVVKPASGYQSIENDNRNAEFSFTFFGSELDASKFDKKKAIFIPYAALNLSEGSHTISAKAFFAGTDGAGVKHQQKFQKDSIIFIKPATKTFTLNIDYIEANTLNSKGQAWDYSFFRTDAPDVGVTILMGNTAVWKNNVNDTYMFAVGPNSKNIAFTISENDKVAVLVQDVDIIFHDFIAKWNFTTDDKKLNTVYTYNKSKGNIKSCNLTFKIE